jgi:hypothetical protein
MNIILSRRLAKVVIDNAVALGLNPIYILHDFCKIISDGDNVKYKQLFGDVHQAIFEQRDTIPFLIEEPEKI